MSFSCVGEFPKDRALCMALREVLNLPTREIFRNIGPDSLLILLDQLNSSACEQSIFMFWRAMHLRNDLIFGKGKESITGLLVLWIITGRRLLLAIPIHWWTRRIKEKVPLPV